MSLALVATGRAHGEANEVRVLYRLNPPLIMRDADRPESTTGFVYDFMKHVFQERVAQKYKISEFSEVPLARGLKEVLNNKGTIFFNIVNSTEREKKFRLIKIPEVSENTYLFALKERNLKIENIKDIVKYSLGFVLGSSVLDVLKDAGLSASRAEGVSSHDGNFAKLIAGRVDLAAAPDYVAKYILNMKGVEDRVEKVVFLQRNEFYMIADKEIDDALFQVIKAEIDHEEKSESFDILIKKYDIQQK